VSRRAGRVDANHGAIVEVLEAHGWTVISLANVGRGVPDLLVGRTGAQEGYGRCYLIEVKDGAKKPSARKLTPDQVRVHANMPVVVIASVDEAIAWCRAQARRTA
jgi:hypothetical protein